MRKPPLLQVLETFGNRILTVTFPQLTPYGLTHKSDAKTQRRISPCFVLEHPHTVQDQHGAHIQCSTRIAVPPGSIKPHELANNPHVHLPPGPPRRIIAIQAAPIVSRTPLPAPDMWSVE